MKGIAISAENIKETFTGNGNSNRRHAPIGVQLPIRLAQATYPEAGQMAIIKKQMTK